MSCDSDSHTAQASHINQTISVHNGHGNGQIAPQAPPTNACANDVGRRQQGQLSSPSRAIPRNRRGMAPRVWIPQRPHDAAQQIRDSAVPFAGAAITYMAQNSLAPSEPNICLQLTLRVGRTIDEGAHARSHTLPHSHPSTHARTHAHTHTHTAF